MTYSKEYIDRAEEVILHTYNRFQIVLDKGNGKRNRHRSIQKTGNMVLAYA